MKSYLDKYRRVLGAVGALIACVVAVIYLVVVPEESADVGWIQKTILIYGHSLCWFLLGGASVLWAVRGKNRWSELLAYIALAFYALFISTLLITESVQNP